MKKLILLICFLALGAVWSCGGGGDGVAADNSKLSGNWSYVLMMQGSFATLRGAATFDGNGNGTNTEVENSTGVLGGGDGPFLYTAYVDGTVVLEDMVGTLSSDGNFMVATDTDPSDGAIMMMLAVKQPTGASVADLIGDFYTGIFSNDSTGTSSVTTVVRSAMGGDGTGTSLEIAPGVAVGTFGYTTAGDGTTVFDDAVIPTPTGQVGIISADGNLFISADTDQYPGAPVNGTISCAMSVKTDGTKTNASLNGTYILHQMMDDQVGDAGNAGFQTNRFQVIFNGDGTGTYSHLATSKAGGLDPSGILTYIVDTITNPDTFLMDGADYGVISVNADVIGIVNVDSGDGTVSLMVGIKQ